MTFLSDYNQFAGTHWETGSIHNHLAAQGFKVPQTGKPLSEAMLLGISGGLVFGYFFFSYEGLGPQVALLTRNTFDPVETLLSRLGVIQTVKQTTNAEKGRQNLLDCLDNGIAPIVWADMFMMPHATIKMPEMWGMMPLNVYGYGADVTHVADRAQVGLTVPTDVFDAARSRVKKDKHRLLTLSAPNWDKLPTAIAAGLQQTVALFLEKPPKGSKNNFGAAAYQNWIKLLTKPKTAKSWAKVLPAGPAMYAGQVDVFDRSATFGQATGGAEREMYADFLDEASTVLQRPELAEISLNFRESAMLWRQLGKIVLPNTVDIFGKTRALIEKRRDVFHLKGSAAIAEIDAISAELQTIREQMKTDYPLDEAQAETMRQDMAATIAEIHDLELSGIQALQAAIS